jgi:hypothetical protein
MDQSPVRTDLRFPGWTAPAAMAPDLVRSWKAFYRHIWSEYGVSPTFYRQLYLAQLGRCFVCRTAKGVHPDDPRGRGGRRLGVDHNHSIGNRIEAVRGLLCTGSVSANTCNRMIARYPADALERATALLTDPPAQRLRRMVNDQTGDADVTGVLT